jgi:hypothetical protein
MMHWGLFVMFVVLAVVRVCVTQVVMLQVMMQEDSPDVCGADHRGSVSFGPHAECWRKCLLRMLGAATRWLRA